VQKTSLLLIVILLLCSCSKSGFDETLKISVTTWVGYTPLYYAKEKGWLDEVNIKLVNAVSLSENMYLYQAGNSDAFCGTQYEYSVLKLQSPDIIPIMLFDRSNGGDLIMSNHSLTELKNSKADIQAYLEIDSINYTLLEDFIKKFSIDEQRINFINRDQAEISALKNTNKNEQIVIVTYIPFNTPLEKNGFKEILSTKTGLDLLVIDSLYTQKETFIRHEQQFKMLKIITDKAINALQEDPIAFFQTIKHYLEPLSYSEFNSGLKDIIWINGTLPESLKIRMRKASFPIKDIL